MDWETRIGTTRVTIIDGDITDQEVDAIVNAANSELQLGAGVAGAIGKRGGAVIQDECNEHGPVGVGEAAITSGGVLPARHVIHAASMHLGGRTSVDSLRSSMDHVFRLAAAHDVRSIAIPAVGTGVAGFPIERCAEIMAGCLRRAVDAGWHPDDVRFVLFGDAAKRAFQPAFEAGLRPLAGP